MSKEYYNQLINDPRVVLSPNNQPGSYAYHLFNLADNYRHYLGARTNHHARYDDLHKGRYCTSSKSLVRPMLEDENIRQDFMFVIIPAENLDVSVHMYEYNELTRLDAVANTSMYNTRIFPPPVVMDELYPVIDNLLKTTDMTNVDIAKQAGVSDKTVRERRKELGIGPTISRKQLTREQWDLIDNLLTTTDMFIMDIANHVGVGYGSVARRRKKLQQHA